jgi:hypothetical protein
LASPEPDFGRGRFRRIALVAGLAAGALPLVLRAQMVSDVVPRERIVPEQEQIQTSMEQSRLRLGPIRLIPGVFVSNLGYDSNPTGTPENPVGAFTASVAAGTKLVVPLGSKLFLLGDAYPSYTYYEGYPRLSRWGGVANASLAGYFNRMSFQAGGRWFQSVRQTTEEQQSPLLDKRETVYANVEIDLLRRLSLFGGAAAQKVRNEQLEAPPPDQLPAAFNDRTDEAFQGGFRFNLGGTWQVAPEVQYTTSNFVLTPEERNNTSMGYLLGVSYNQPRLYINVIGGYRVGRPWNGSSFPEYEEPVGSFFVSYFLRSWLEIQGHGWQRVSYSINVANPYFISTNIGGGLNVQVGPNILLKAFAATGQNDYPFPVPTGGALVPRLDDIVRYGGGASVKVYKRLVLTATVMQREQTSTIPENTYNLLQFATFLSFSGEFMR